MSIDFMSWPVVPDHQRPKPLYHVGMEPQEAAVLLKSGWEPQDVRLLDNETDEEKTLAVRAWLEGVRLGSIDATRGVTKFIEMEARILGLPETKKRVSDAPKTKKETVEALLDFGRSTV